MHLYRSVDIAELADIRRLGRLRPLTHTMQGKHLAIRREDAIRWGRSFYAAIPYAILTVEVLDPQILSRAEHWERLDAIGPAYFIVADDLSFVRIIAVAEMP